jgi:mannose-6-phosphate isomerase
MINPISDDALAAKDSIEPARSHHTNVRTWGTVTVLEESDRYRINRIEVKPGASMCLQMHYHRSEHWVIVSGTATVTCDDRVTQLIAKQSTYVPMGTRHQVTNPGVIPLVMIEVQNGEYIGEDDIIRLGVLTDDQPQPAAS